MKTFSLLSVLASLSAAVLLPVRLELAGSMLFAAGVVLLMVQDYSARRTLRFESAGADRCALTARQVFRQCRARPRATFRAPALASEHHRLAA